MIKRERLYDAFGELIYAIAIADGEIQFEEVKAFDDFLSSHPYAKEIKWSFDYEKYKGNSLEDAYIKARNVCMENGPDPEYKFLVDLMTKVAEAFGGIDPREEKIINDFKEQLSERFIKDFRSHRLEFQDEDS